MGKPVLLAEGPPSFIYKGELFYADVGIENAPVLAYTPHDLLAAIAAAQAAYAQWEKQGNVVRAARY